MKTNERHHWSGTLRLDTRDALECFVGFILRFHRRSVGRILTIAQAAYFLVEEDGMLISSGGFRSALFGGRTLTHGLGGSI